MENEEEKEHKDPPNQEVEIQTQCGRLKNEERDTLWQIVLASGRLYLNQDYTDTGGIRRMEDYESGLRSSISTCTHW